MIRAALLAAGLFLLVPLSSATALPGGGPTALRVENGVLRDAYGAVGRAPGDVPDVRTLIASLDLPAESRLEPLGVKRSLTATHVAFQQHWRGIPVVGGFVAAHVLHDGRVAAVHSRAVTALESGAPATTEPQAVVRALERSPGDALALRHVVLADGLIGRPAFEIEVGFPDVAASRLVYVSSIDGRILDIRDTFAAATAPAKVWINPITEADDPDLRDRTFAVTVPNARFSDPEALAGPDLSGLYRDAEVVGLTEGPFGPYLVGPHVDVVNGLARGDSMVFDRGDPRFTEVMAYYWIDRSQRHIQDLGFDDAANFSVRVHFYDGLDSQRRIVTEGAYAIGTEIWFGTWPVIEARPPTVAFRGVGNSAEDADIILHEYGHVVMADSACCDGPGQALNEGWADFWSATQVNVLVGAPYDTCEGEWGRSYTWTRWEGILPCFRNARNSLAYSDAGDPEHPSHYPHYWGQVWQGALWNLRDRHGAEEVERLVLESNYYLPPDANFTGGAEALLLADYALTGGELGLEIAAEFARRNVTGILVDAEVFAALEDAALALAADDAALRGAPAGALLPVLVVLLAAAVVRRRLVERPQNA